MWKSPSAYIHIYQTRKILFKVGGAKQFEMLYSNNGYKNFNYSAAEK